MEYVLAGVAAAVERGSELRLELAGADGDDADRVRFTLDQLELAPLLEPSPGGPSSVLVDTPLVAEVVEVAEAERAEHGLVVTTRPGGAEPGVVRVTTRDPAAIADALVGWADSRSAVR